MRRDAGSVPLVRLLEEANAAQDLNFKQMIMKMVNAL